MYPLDPESRPALRPDLAVIPMADGVQLRAGDEEIHVLSAADPTAARAVLALLRRLDGTRTVGQLLADPRPDAPGWLRTVLDQLSSQGLLVGGAQPGGAQPGGAQPGGASADVLRYLSHFPEYVAAGSPSLGDARVRVAGHAACAGAVARALAEHGIVVETRVQEGGTAAARPGGRDGDEAGGEGGTGEARAAPAPHAQPPHALVCAWERPDLGLALAVNAAALRARAACLFVDLSHGRHATLGPFFVPGEGACYACFRARLRQNTAAREELEAAEELMRRGPPLPAYGLLPAFRGQLAALAAAEVVAFLSRHRPLRTLNRIITVDFEAVGMWSEPAWRVPWCEACGESSVR